MCPDNEKLYALLSNITADAKTERQTGRQAQLSNIAAARAVADIIRSTLGPRSMLKVNIIDNNAIISFLGGVHTVH